MTRTDDAESRSGRWHGRRVGLVADTQVRSDAPAEQMRWMKSRSTRAANLTREVSWSTMRRKG